MDNRSFGSGGALFVRNKKNPKAADYGGDFTLEGEELAYVLANAGSGKVKLEFSGWKRMGRNDTTFISVKVETPYETRGGQSRQPQGRGNYGGGQRQQSFGGGQQWDQRPQRQDYGRNDAPRRDMRQDLNDDIPDFNRPRGGRGSDNSPPWE